MSPGKMSTSLAKAVDSSTIASISSTTDTDDGIQIRDEAKSDAIENSNVQKSIHGTEAFIVGLSNGASGERNESVFRAETNEERIKLEVSKMGISFVTFFVNYIFSSIGFSRMKNNFWVR